MNTSTPRQRQYLRRIALGLVVAAIAAPIAQAQEASPDRTAPTVLSTIESREKAKTVAQEFAMTLAAPPTVLSSSESREKAKTVAEELVATLPGTTDTAVYPSSRERLIALERLAWREMAQNLAATLPASIVAANQIDPMILSSPEARVAARDIAQGLVSDLVAPAQTTAATSFDFRDAAIGGAVVLGALLIGAAAALLVRNRQRIAHP